MNSKLRFSALARATAVLGTGQAALAVIQILAGLIIARALGPRDFGRFSTVISIVIAAHAFFAFRTEEALTRFLEDSVKARNEEKQWQKARLYRAALTAELMVRVPIVILMQIVSQVLVAQTGTDDKEIWKWVAVFSWSILFGLFEPLWGACARVERKHEELALVPGVSAAIHLAILFLLDRATNLSLHDCLLLLVFSSLVKGGIVTYKFLKHDGRVLAKYPSSKRYEKNGKDAEFWTFMKIGYLSSSLSSFVKNGDVWLLAAIADLYQVGLYKAARSISSLPGLLGQILARLILPDLIESPGSSLATVKKLGRLSVGLFCLAAGGLILFYFMGPMLLKAMLGEEYVPGFSACFCLLIGVSVNLVFFWVHPLILAIGRVDVLLRVTGVTALLFLLLNLALTPSFGALGMAFSVCSWWIVGIGLLFLHTIRRTMRDG
jgi:O-antigen/teichoic acid export membrane protein